MLFSLIDKERDQLILILIVILLSHILNCGDKECGSCCWDAMENIPQPSKEQHID